MNPRIRRLSADRRLMEERSGLGLFTFRSEGELPERYEVEFQAPGLALDDGRIVCRDLHACVAYLHRDYPRRPPVVSWKTPVFHPNLLSPERNGGVCIGAWRASESLADLMYRLKDLVAYKAFNTNDALDNDAAAWVLEQELEPGFAVEDVIGQQLEPVKVGRGAS